MISAFMLISLISVFQVTLVSAQGLPELIPCEFQIGENSSVWWTTADVHAGMYSVLLSTLYPTPLSHHARVAMPYGDTLDSISGISYWEHYVKDWSEPVTELWGIWVSIALDTDSDGAADRWLLGDPSLQGWPCTWNDWVQRTFDDTALFISPVDFPGTEWTFTLAEWKAGVAQSPISGDSRVLQVKLAIGEGAAGEGWPPDHYKNVYVDEITINGVTHDLEPRVINDTTKAGYNTIQDAIDNARPSDTVLVYPGTYEENITIDRSLTLKSVELHKAVVKGYITIDADDVTIDGFEVDCTDMAVMAHKRNDITVQNILVDGGDGPCIWVQGDSPTNRATGITIQNNTLRNTISDSGLHVNFTDGAIVSGNVIENTPFVAVLTMGNKDLIFENNVLTGNLHGIAVHGSGTYVAQGAIVRNNTVANCANLGIAIASAENVVLEFNEITNNGVGIDHGDGWWTGAGESKNNVAHYNNIIGNGCGVNNWAKATFDATLNWWGDPGGPVADEDGNGVYGDNVSVNVNYDPWLPRTLPAISDVSVSRVTVTTATITWKTVLPANSWVDYGPTIAYGLTSSIPDLTTSHSLKLSGLTPSTTYHFRVRSEDAYGHVDNSGDLTFITAAPPPPPATLTVDTTPIKANVYVGGSLLGVVPRTRSLAAGTYTISFGDVLGYLTPAPEIVTLAAGETRTVTGVYTEIPPENIENQSPTYDIPSITTEENATILVENTALTDITIQVESAAENVKITVQEVTEGAAGIAIGAPGATYKYLNIVAENITDAQIGSVVIHFKVEKSWIILNDIDIATITLNHYDPLTGEWTSLPTTYLSEDDTYVYFSAISPGLSIFGVSGSTIIPANFELSNLVITPSEVSVGETVTISVVVNNVGGQTGSTTVNLEINGVAVDTRSVTLDVGKSTTVTFTVSEDVAGTYTVNVAGLTGSFVVTAPAPPIVLLAVSIVLAIGIVMWLWRIR